MTGSWPRRSRSETASIRALTFTSARLSIELEVAEDLLLGQVVPPRAGTLEVHTKAGVTTSPVDEIGCFTVDPIPASPFRLRCRTDGRRRRADRMDHAVSSSVAGAQAAPRVTRDTAVACWTGSSVARAGPGTRLSQGLAFLQ